MDYKSNILWHVSLLFVAKNNEYILEILLFL